MNGRGVGEGGGRRKGKKMTRRASKESRVVERRVGRVWLDPRQKVKGLVYRTPAGQKLVYVVSFS